MSAGQFTCATLAEIQLKEEEFWNSPSTKKDYTAEVEALSAIRTEQTVRFTELEEPDKDKEIKAYWVQNCDTGTSACTDECSVGGNEPEAACETYALDICRKVGFTVDEKTFRTIAPTMEEAVAKSFLRKMKLLDEYLAEQAVVVINANVGANQYTGGKGTVAGFSTTIPAQYWNASLFSYLALVAKKNKFADSYLLSGSNLFEAAWNAKMAQGNAEGKGDAAKFGSMRQYYDVFNIDTILDPDKATFLIDKNALGFASKVYYPASQGAPRDYGVSGAGLKWTKDSMNLPGVKYDVTYKITCESDRIKHHFSIQVKAGIFVNPVGCNPNNKGLLKFKCA